MDSLIVSIVNHLSVESVCHAVFQFVHSFVIRTADKLAVMHRIYEERRQMAVWFMQPRADIDTTLLKLRAICSSGKKMKQAEIEILWFIGITLSYMYILDYYVIALFQLYATWRENPSDAISGTGHKLHSCVV